MRMLKTFFRELTTQSNTAFSLGTRLIVLRGLKVGCSEFVIWRNQRRFKTNLIEAETWALEELAMIWSCWGFALSSSPWNEQEGDALTPTEFAKFGIELYLFTIITVINVFFLLFSILTQTSMQEERSKLRSHPWCSRSPCHRCNSDCEDNICGQNIVSIPEVIDKIIKIKRQRISNYDIGDLQ